MHPPTSLEYAANLQVDRRGTRIDPVIDPLLRAGSALHPYGYDMDPARTPDSTPKVLELSAAPTQTRLWFRLRRNLLRLRSTLVYG
jgi:hypothetical protein